MKVYLFDENRVNIYLNLQEINDIFGGYENIDYNMPDCRVKIHGLIAATLPAALLPLDCTKILIEVKPNDAGCTITLTKVYGDKLKCNTITETVLIFENSEALICSVKELNKLNFRDSELYTNNQKYAIILTMRDNKPIHISEYCKVIASNHTSEKIREYWQKICDNNAITLLSNSFLK